MNVHGPVRQFMTPDPESVQVDAPVSAIRALLQERPFHHVPVLDGAVLVGMVSAHDLARVSLETWVGRATADAEVDALVGIGDLMTPEPEVVQADASLLDAATLLSEGRFHALPVLDGGRLVGMVTTTDVVRAVVAG